MMNQIEKTGTGQIAFSLGRKYSIRVLILIVGALSLSSAHGDTYYSEHGTFVVNELKTSVEVVWLRGSGATLLVGSGVLQDGYVKIELSAISNTSLITQKIGGEGTGGSAPISNGQSVCFSPSQWGTLELLIGDKNTQGVATPASSCSQHGRPKAIAIDLSKTSK